MSHVVIKSKKRSLDLELTDDLQNQLQEVLGWAADEEMDTASIDCLF